MDAPAPTRKAFELGIWLISEPAPGLNEEAVIAMLEEDTKIVATMLANEAYTCLAAQFRRYLYSSPVRQSAVLQFHGIAAIMAKLFQAGYAAGRQEVMDAEAERILSAGER